jgi:hypothetical protein
MAKKPSDVVKFKDIEDIIIEPKTKKTTKNIENFVKGCKSRTGLLKENENAIEEYKKRGEKSPDLPILNDAGCRSFDKSKPLSLDTKTGESIQCECRLVEKKRAGGLFGTKRYCDTIC